MRNFSSLILCGASLAACVINSPGTSDTDAESSSGGGSGGTFGMGTTSGPSPTSGPGPTSGPSATDGPETTDATTSTTASTVTTSDPSTTTLPDLTTTSGQTDSDPSQTATSSDSGTTDPPACSDPPGQPLDAECTDESGCGCKSGSCFVMPVLGGFCGECKVDADCNGGGCTVPNLIGGIGARCNKGLPGDGCETSAVCADPTHPHCGNIMDVPGIITVNTCSQCVTNAECPPAAPNCAPDYDLDAFSGVLNCVANESLPLGAGCAPADGNQPAGHAACASGHCAEGNVMGLLILGVCSECTADADCGAGEVCSAPVIDLDAGMLSPGLCM